MLAYEFIIIRNYEIVKYNFRIYEIMFKLYKKDVFKLVSFNNLFARMEELNKNAKTVSAETGISTGNISDWKSGRSMPSASKLVILAKCLDCSADYLLGITDMPNSEESDPVLVKINTLNDIGKQKALEYIKDLAENPRYRISVPDDVKIVAQKKPEKTPKADDKPRLI